jgi:hypothetical protein
VAEPDPTELSLTILSFGQSSAQAVLVTVTVKLQEAVLFAGLVAVQVTVVLPVENTEPEAGLQTTVTQFPVVVGAG